MSIHGIIGSAIIIACIVVQSLSRES